MPEHFLDPIRQLAEQPKSEFKESMRQAKEAHDQYMPYEADWFSGLERTPLQNLVLLREVNELFERHGVPEEDRKVLADFFTFNLQRQFACARFIKEKD